MSTDLDDFETSLLHHLRKEVASRQQRPQRRWGLIGGGAGVAALAGGLLLPGLVASPAYSVAEGNAGEIIAQVNRLEDADGLEQALAKKGVEADITYLDYGQQCRPGRYRPVPGPTRDLFLSVGEQSFEVRLGPGAVRDGETLVISASLRRIPAIGDPDGDGIEELGGVGGRVDAEVARGPVGECDPTDV